MKNRFLTSLVAFSLLMFPSMFGVADVAKAAEPRKMKLILGTDASEDTVTQLFSLKFAELVKERSKGNMTVQVHANGTIGSDTDNIKNVKTTNGIHFAAQTTAHQVTYVPEAALFDIPCPFKTIEEVRAAYNDEDFFKTISAAYDKAGYRILGYADQGFRVMSSNKNIEKLADFKGIKIRTMPNSNHLAFWKAIGANPTPMTFSEVYTSLQNGTIDAQENPYEVIVGNKFYEQQKYVIATNHLVHTLSLVTGKAFYDKLNEAERQIIDSAVADAKVYACEQTDARIKDRVAIIEGANTQVIAVSDELYKDMVDASQSVYEAIEKQVGSELFNKYLKR